MCEPYVSLTLIIWSLASFANTTAAILGNHMAGPGSLSEQKNTVMTIVDWRAAARCQGNNSQLAADTLLLLSDAQYMTVPYWCRMVFMLTQCPTSRHHHALSAARSGQSQQWCTQHCPSTQQVTGIGVRILRQNSSITHRGRLQTIDSRTAATRHTLTTRVWPGSSTCTAYAATISW